jgi:AraC family transcriptional regulator of adaptative response/methylated-DNA-[protein]-cysteine methyltransferase
MNINDYITIEPMAPEEYRDGGKDLCINYSFAEASFGSMIIASTHKGI